MSKEALKRNLIKILEKKLFEVIKKLLKFSGPLDLYHAVIKKIKNDAHQFVPYLNSGSRLFQN